MADAQASSSTLYAQYGQALQGRPKPLAWLDLDALEANARSLLDRAGDQPIRLATKSIRSVTVIRHVQKLSPRFRGLMCFHPLEAVWLAECGFRDLLVAYPVIEPHYLARIAQAVAGGADIRLMTDSPAHLRAAQAAAQTAGSRMTVWADVDCSTPLPGLWFGVKRSPLRDPAAWDAYLDALAACPNLDCTGLMGYEAQLAGVANAVPGKGPMNAVIRALQSLSRPRVAAKRQAIRDHFERRGVVLEDVNGGGTGSLESTAAEAGITEVAAGSGLYSPTLFDGYAHFQHRPAAGFALEVTRIPEPGIATCFGGGYIASGPAGRDKVPVPWLPDGLSLLPNEQAGEVQTPLHDAQRQLVLGDSVFFRHAKAGELCARFPALAVLRGTVCEAEWPTYRGEGHWFLG